MTNCFLIADEASRQAAIFDAPDHTTEPLLKEAKKRGLEVIGLWLTHGHFDHFADHLAVRQHFPSAKVMLHRLDEPKARRPELQTRLFGLPFTIAPLTADGYLEDNQELKVGSLTVTVLHTPGHSPGHVVFHFPKERVLVGGDLIIGGSVGRTDLPDSRQADLVASLRRVMALPRDTRLLGGHGPASTLAHEALTNPYVQAALA
jgi:glyoxylase-like metal-dependent hydrolase (beta-lactamase superfamily II)